MKFDATRVGVIYNPKESAAYVQEAGKMFTREDVLDILSKVGVPDTADVITELLGEE